jgi:hypothetical protein
MPGVCPRSAPRRPLVSATGGQSLQTGLPTQQVDELPPLVRIEADHLRREVAVHVEVLATGDVVCADHRMRGRRVDLEHLDLLLVAQEAAERVEERVLEIERLDARLHVGRQPLLGGPAVPTVDSPALVASVVSVVVIRPPVVHTRGYATASTSNC